MKAVTLKAFGGVDNFAIKDIPEPEIQEHEVLVKVKAVSINPAETMIRAGKAFTENYEGRENIILGWDISGVVEKTGDDTGNFEEGDEVFGMVNFPQPANAYAEYVAAPEDHLAKKPANISHEEAAGATLAALTAWQALTLYDAIEEDSKVLIQSAAGGVGHFAVQMAKDMGAYVVGTASAENAGFLKQLGCDEHINYRQQKFEEVVKDADFVLDAVGGDNSYRSLEALKEEGTVVSLLGIATDLPDKAQEQNKNGYIHLVSPSADDMDEIAEMLENGILKTHVAKTFPYQQMADAHHQVETRKTRGKVVVTF